MKKYVCLRCGYIYDPAKGDAKGGIAPGTDLAEIRSGWTCPRCDASLDDFARKD